MADDWEQLYDTDFESKTLIADDKSVSKKQPATKLETKLNKVNIQTFLEDVWDDNVEFEEHEIIPSTKVIETVTPTKTVPTKTTPYRTSPSSQVPTKTVPVKLKHKIKKPIMTYNDDEENFDQDELSYFRIEDRYS